MQTKCITISTVEPRYKEVRYNKVTVAGPSSSMRSFHTRAKCTIWMIIRVMHYSNDGILDRVYANLHRNV